MSKILKKVGLNASEVRALLNAPEPSNVQISEYTPTNKYWYGPNQKRMSERLKANEGWIISQYLIFDKTPEVIAQFLGVSCESVRRRLRAKSLFNSNGKAGRPPATDL